MANGVSPRCGAGGVDPHKIKRNIQSQAVVSPVFCRGESLGPDKVPDRRVAGGPFPDTVQAHVCSRHPPDVAPLHLEEAKLCPDEVKLNLGGNFGQGASGLKLAEVVGGSPVGARGRVEEQAADVHRVAIHPPIRAASLLEVNVNQLISFVFICWTEEEFNNHKPVLPAKVRKGKGEGQQVGLGMKLSPPSCLYLACCVLLRQLASL